MERETHKVSLRTMVVVDWWDENMRARDDWDWEWGVTNPISKGEVILVSNSIKPNSWKT